MYIYAFINEFTLLSIYNIFIEKCIDIFLGKLMHLLVHSYRYHYFTQVYVKIFIEIFDLHTYVCIFMHSTIS